MSVFTSGLAEQFQYVPPMIDFVLNMSSNTSDFLSLWCKFRFYFNDVLQHHFLIECFLQGDHWRFDSGRWQYWSWSHHGFHWHIFWNLSSCLFYNPCEGRHESKILTICIVWYMYMLYKLTHSCVCFLTLFTHQEC